MPWRDQTGFDAERVDLVEHALDQAFGRVLGRAVRAQARDAERAGRRREDDVAAGWLVVIRALRCLRAEERQRELDDVQGADEVGLELGADVVVVLVFAGADDAVAGAAVVKEGL